jgi:drug/metabolite transporter (DMT)-like permease
MQENKAKAINALPDLALLLVAMVWGTTFVMVKDALSSVDANALIAYRFAIAAALLGALLLLKRKNIFADWKNGLLIGFVLWLSYITQTIGLKHTSASNSAFITALYVILTPFISYLLFKKIPGKRKILAALVSVTGLWILTGGVNGMNYGDLITLGAAVTAAAYIILVGKLDSKTDAMVSCFQQFTAVTLLSALAAFFTSPTGFMVSSQSAWNSVIFLALFPSLLAYLLQVWAQKKADETKTALILSLEAVFAAFFAWGFGGEIFSMKKAIGGGIMLIGTVLSEIELKEENKQKIWKK